MSVSRQSPWTRWLSIRISSTSADSAAAEAVVAGLQDRLVAELLEEPDELAAPARVAVDDDGPGRLVSRTGRGSGRPGSTRRTGAGRQRDQGPRGGELDAPPGADSASTRGWGGRSRGRVRSVTWPRAVAAAAARSSLPSAIAVRTTSRKHVRPGGQGRGERAPVLGRERGEADALNGLFQRQADRGGAGIRSRGCISSASRASWSPKYPSASPRVIGRGTGTLRSSSQAQTATGSLGNST